MWEFAEEFSINWILQSFSIWSKLERWKHSISVYLKIKKKKSICSIVFSYSTQQRTFLDQIVTCDKKWILYNWQWPAQRLDCKEALKHFPQANLQQQQQQQQNSPANYHFFKHLYNFLQGKWFYNQQEAKNAFQDFIESWSTDFYATEINVFLIGKNVLTIMAPILINKDMFEPSYNDFKFMVQNHCYFCWNTRFNVTCFPNSLFL